MDLVFIGTVSDLDRNRLLWASKLSQEDHVMFARLYNGNVRDSRNL